MRKRKSKEASPNYESSIHSGFCEKNHIENRACEDTHLIKRACENTHNVHSNCENSHHHSPNREIMRLNRAIAATGLCSRRKADKLILSGQIAVNGKIQRNPATHVSSLDALTCSGRQLQAPDKTTTIVLNKPVEIICTASDPAGRKTVLDLLPNNLRKLRLYPVGRLDYFSEGLLVLTNNGDLAYRLAHPSCHIPKVYEVTIRGGLPDDALLAFRSGLTLPEGRKLRPVEVDAKKLPNGNTLLHITLQEGVNRQIRKMCAVFDLVILKLKRVSQGPLTLGNLAPGRFRNVTAKELAALKQTI